MTTFKRTTILLTDAQIAGLKEVAKSDPDGLKAAALIRIAINNLISRRGRQAPVKARRK
jgi:hypothetical protein